MINIIRVKTYDIAVVGATGLVGETLLELLQSRQFPVRDLYPLASERSRGKKIIFSNLSASFKFSFNTIFFSPD